MKKFFMLFLVLTLAVVGVACNNADSDSATPEANSGEKITVEHELGKTEVTKNPKRVIVFDFGVLDTLDKLGIEVIALPKTNIPSYLAKYNDNKYEDVGSLKEPDFEKISELSPDLIIISTRQSELYNEFTKIAPTIYVAIDTKDYLNSFEKNMKTLGQIFGKEAEVEQELNAIRASVDNVKQKATASNKKALIILANDNKISAYGPQSRFGIIHDVLGLAPVDTNIEASTHGQSISFEYVVEKNPDILYVIDRGAVVENNASAKQTVENDLVKKTKAYQDGNIVYLDPNIWYLSGGGLQSMNEMIKEIDQSIK